MHQGDEGAWVGVPRDKLWWVETEPGTGEAKVLGGGKVG